MEGSAAAPRLYLTGGRARRPSRGPRWTRIPATCPFKKVAPARVGAGRGARGGDSGAREGTAGPERSRRAPPPAGAATGGRARGRPRSARCAPGPAWRASWRAASAAGLGCSPGPAAAVEAAVLGVGSRGPSQPSRWGLRPPVRPRSRLPGAGPAPPAPRPARQRPRERWRGARTKVSSVPLGGSIRLIP